MNCVVLYIFLVQDRRLLNRTTQYIAAVCFCDLFIATFGLIMVVASCFAKKWLFDEVGCVYYAFLMTFLGIATIFLLSVISFDRYIVIVKPIIAQSMTKRFGAFAIFGCYSFALLWAVLPLFGWSSYRYDGIDISCALDQELENNTKGWTYHVAMLIICFFLPLSVMIFSYTSVFRKIIRESKSYLRTTLNRTALSKVAMEARKSAKLEHDLAVTIALMIGAFLLCWTPYVCLLLYRVFHTNSRVSPMVASIPPMIAKTAIMFNPVIYLYRNRPFRATVISLLPILKVLRPSRTEPLDTVTEGFELTSVTRVNRGETADFQDEQSPPEHTEEISERQEDVTRTSSNAETANLKHRRRMSSPDASLNMTKIFHNRPSSETRCRTRSSPFETPSSTHL